MLYKNKNLLIIALVVMVNMLGYGIIIPIIYSYSKKFGLSDFDSGMLFASFSVAQFLSTPIIGRLSDKYGRKPMLLLSISGTAISFFMLAYAPNAVFLFIARIIDGFTAGNLPVAYAVISDSTKPEERAGAFGVLGSALNFGFIFGPAVAALTTGLGEAVPFIIAGVITIIALILTKYFLPETNTNMSTIKKGKLIDIPKLWHTLFDPNLGTTFLITLIYFLAFSCAIIYGFQPFTVNILKISLSQNAMLFTMFGVAGMISQSILVARITQNLGIKNTFRYGILFTVLSFIIMFFSKWLSLFILATIILAVSNSIVQTLIPTILSREVDAKSQGSIMGLNTSYQSIGMIFGPILGGVLATAYIQLPFLIGACFVIICFILSNKVLNHKISLESAFS